MKEEFNCTRYNSHHHKNDKCSLIKELEEKLAVAIEALEKADKTLSLTYYSFQKVRQDIEEALEKIKRQPK